MNLFFYLSVLCPGIQNGHHVMIFSIFNTSRHRSHCRLLTVALEITKESVVIFLTAYNVSIRFFSNTWDKFLNSDKSKTFKKKFLASGSGPRSRLLFWKIFFCKKTQASTTPLGKWTFRIDKTSTSGDVLSLYISRNFQIMSMDHIMCSWLTILIDGPNHVLINI